jgi:hypothetical protein
MREIDDSFNPKPVCAGQKPSRAALNRSSTPRMLMIETILGILFLLAIVLVATGPKRSDEKKHDSDSSGTLPPKGPESPEK